MTKGEQNIIEKIKAHAVLINELFAKLELPVKVKNSNGLTAEQNARLDARLIKKMYK